MKRLLFILCLMLTSVMTLKAATPTVMLIPDDTWAKEKGYGYMKDFKGKQRFVVDYDACFMDRDFANVSTTMKDLLQDYGLQLKDPNAQNEEDAEDDAYDELDDIEVSPLDELANKAKPDMLVKIGWNKSNAGFNYTLQVRIDGIDTYSSKSVATKAITPEKTFGTNESIGAAVQFALNDYMSEFVRKLEGAFNITQTKGREITLRISVKGGSSVNMQTEFGGETLAAHIAKWMDANTVNHQFNERSVSDNRIVYNEVRIPVKSASGGLFNARMFADQLAKYLRSNFNIEVKNNTSGLGKGRLVISD